MNLDTENKRLANEGLVFATDGASFGAAISAKKRNLAIASGLIAA
ncbi:hypothetical protein [Caballeronia arationis]|nr:hypothetical protein [Caballeronia arationis]